ncbi:hypothetical protein ACJX0J_009496, partial [Zea mays]
TGAFNIGIFHWRPTEPAKRLAKDWKDLVISDDKLWDQNAFNDLVRKKFGQPVQGDDLVYSYDGKLKLGVLPASIFCSGHTYFVQGMYKQLHLEPYAVHTTFQYAGTEGKRHRLREAMLFFDQPSYYDSPGGFLSFKPNIPKSLLLDGAHTVESHFELVNYQLKQIRTALAVASLLKRTLVMPPLWCRLDRMWFGHPGILEGTMTRQPFLCPLDHVFEVHVMLKDLPKEEFGQHIDFREYSFLENPSLPKEVKDSLLEVELCDEHSSRCSAIDEIDKHGTFLLPRNSTEEKLLDLLSSYKDVKIIQFSSMVDAFGGFADAPRYFCKTCRRYWTKGGALRNVPVGGGCRKNKRSRSAAAVAAAAAAAAAASSSRLSLNLPPEAAAAADQQAARLGFLGAHHPVASSTIDGGGPAAADYHHQQAGAAAVGMIALPRLHAPGVVGQYVPFGEWHPGTAGDVVTGGAA